MRLKPATLYELLRELEALRPSGRLDYKHAQMVRKHTAIKILYDLAHALWLQINEKTDDHTPGEIMPSFEYIKSHLSERLSIDALARLCNVSRSTYQHHFKELTWLSPGQYILRLRIEKAQALMRSGVKTSVAAREAGFFDAAHLEKYVRKSKQD